MLLTKHNGRRKQLKRGTEGVACSMTELRSPDSLSSLTDSEEDCVVFSASVVCCAQSFIFGIYPVKPLLRYLGCTF